jgi:hypothetical protein
MGLSVCHATPLLQEHDLSRGNKGNLTGKEATVRAEKIINLKYVLIQQIDWYNYFFFFHRAE